MARAMPTRIASTGLALVISPGPTLASDSGFRTRSPDRSSQSHSLMSVSY